MKTVNLRRFTEPDTLREMSPRLLVALLDEHRPFLASKGVELPPVGEEAELNHEALAQVFTALEDIPPDLVDRFHLVKQMAGPRQMDRILEAIRERQLQFTLPVEHSSPEDVAAHLLLTQPALFQELHAEIGVTRYRAFVHFVPRRKPATFKMPASVAGLEKTLNSWYEAHQRARSARVFWRRHGDECRFHVRHADPVKRDGCVGLKDGESGSTIYRPERHGLVIYDERTGELRVHADSERETELFRVAFGLHLFRDGTHFPASNHKFTLAPLKAGRVSLACGGIEAMLNVALTEIEYVADGEFGARERLAATDVFSVFEARRFALAEKIEVTMAKFSVLFRGETRRRNFTIRPSNYATFSREEDSGLLHPWMVRQGFVLGNKDAIANEPWTLELVAEGAR